MHGDRQLAVVKLDLALELLAPPAKDRVSVDAEMHDRSGNPMLPESSDQVRPSLDEHREQPVCVCTVIVRAQELQSGNAGQFLLVIAVRMAILTSVTKAMESP